MQMTEDAKETFRNADCVTFDVDSTVCTDEGIDELALFLGRGAEIQELTHSAMEGGMGYTESLRRRLEILRPSISSLRRFKEQRTISLSPGINDLIEALHKRGVCVCLVTGGFHDLVDEVAQTLKILPENVYANRIHFDASGSYDGFDEERPTSRDLGKAEVIQSLKELRGFNRLVHVGDGVTDACARPPADAFVGYGGNRVREKVRQMSNWYVMDFHEMLDELNLRKTD